jgi:hypothetical protein
LTKFANNTVLIGFRSAFSDIFPKGGQRKNFTFFTIRRVEYEYIIVFARNFEKNYFEVNQTFGLSISYPSKNAPACLIKITKSFFQFG